MCGGGGGQRGLEQEEKDLLRMQAQVAGQGIRGREEAMGGFRDLRARGRERASIANQNQEAGRVMEDAYAGYGNAQRMREAQMAGMGVRGNPDNMFRGRDDAGVGMAAQAASGASAARRNVRQEGMGLETAGLSGLAGFDPSGALNSMSNTIGNARRTNADSDAATAQGWGQLGQAGMYGLKNAGEIEKGAKTVSSWFGRGGGSSPIDSELGFAYGGMVPSYAEGGEVMGMQRYANGGNVYDQAMQDVGQYRPPAAQPAPQPGVNPATAMRVAKMAVDKAASSSLGYGAATPGVSMGSQQAAMLAEQTGAFGAEGLASTAAAAEGATAAAAGAEAAGAAGAGLASGAAGASAALGAAVPILGLGMLAAGLFGRKDGGPIPRAASRPGIGRKQVAGKAQNSKGGKVTGPGGPKDDMVMARLSPGEYVLPVGAVKKYGLDRLEKMRQEGLAFERQRNIA
jgi:hypothetical protein